MEKMRDLKDLLRHEVQDLYSAEQQIIDALPRMIDKVSNQKLKDALQQHLEVTREQKNRLDQVQQKLAEGGGEQGGGQEGLWARLTRRRGESGGQTCRAMQGIVEEADRLLGEEMNPEVLDAAIIACAQKVEHYEITSYGTTRAFARELNLQEVANLLEQTLNEEYEADDRLTELAVGGGLNQRAENARRSAGGGRSTAGNRGGATKGANKSASKGTTKGASKNATKGSTKGATKSATKGASKGGSKAATKSSSTRGASKASSKSAATKGGRTSGGGRGR